MQMQSRHFGLGSRCRPGVWRSFKPFREDRHVGSRAVAQAEDGAVYHTVKAGETLEDIAAKYGVSVRHLKEQNFDRLYQHAAEIGTVPPGRHSLVAADDVHGGRKVTGKSSTAPSPVVLEAVAEPVASKAAAVLSPPYLLWAAGGVVLMAVAAALYKTLVARSLVARPSSSSELVKGPPQDGAAAPRTASAAITLPTVLPPPKQAVIAVTMAPAAVPAAAQVVPVPTQPPATTQVVRALQQTSASQAGASNQQQAASAATTDTSALSAGGALKEAVGGALTSAQQLAAPAADAAKQVAASGADSVQHAAGAAAEAATSSAGALGGAARLGSETASETLASSLTALTSTAKEAAESVRQTGAEAAQGAVGSGQDAARQMVDSSQEAASNAVRSVSDAATSSVEAAAQAVESSRRTAGAAVGAAADAAAPALKAATDAAETLLGSAAAAMSSLGRAVTVPAAVDLGTDRSVPTVAPAAAAAAVRAPAAPVSDEVTLLQSRIARLEEMMSAQLAKAPAQDAAAAAAGLEAAQTLASRTAAGSSSGSRATGKPLDVVEATAVIGPTSLTFSAGMEPKALGPESANDVGILGYLGRDNGAAVSVQASAAGVREGVSGVAASLTNLMSDSGMPMTEGLAARVQEILRLLEPQDRQDTASVQAALLLARAEAGNAPPPSVAAGNGHSSSGQTPPTYSAAGNGVRGVGNASSASTDRHTFGNQEPDRRSSSVGGTASGTSGWDRWSNGVPQRASVRPAVAASAAAAVAAPANLLAGLSFAPASHTPAQPAPAPAAARSTPLPVASPPPQSSSVPPPFTTAAPLVASSRSQQKSASGRPLPAAPRPRPPAAIITEGKSLVVLKSELLDVVYGTARGLDASAEQLAAVEELLAALEARNPNTTPVDAVGALSGRWKLVYTSNTQTLMLLNAIRSIPLVDMGDIYQTIDAVTLTAQNKIEIAMPMLMSLRAETNLAVRTPHQFKVRFTRVGLDTHIEVPNILSALDMPDSISVLGNTIDLTPLRGVVDPVNAGLDTARSLVSSLLSPEIEIDAGEASCLWMMTTYLDDNFRISRDDEGRVFVMLKDISLFA